MQKTLLVTGANRGLGAAFAAQFHAAGWRVIGTSRTMDGLPTGEGLEFHPLDLSDEKSVAAFAERILEMDVSLDLIVNNAGFNPKDRKGDPDYFQSTFKIEHFAGSAVAESLWINALMPFEMVSKLLPSFSEDGVVLNVSSWLGSITKKTNPGHYGYAGSKALLNMFTKGLALEFQDTSRSAVALNPGWMRTDMGGDTAETEPTDVANNVRGLFESGALTKSNGKFLNADGSEHAW